MTRIDVVEYPLNPLALQNTKATLEGLRHALHVDYQIDLPIEIASLEEISPEWPPFLSRVVGASIKLNGAVCSRHLYLLLAVAGMPEIVQSVEKAFIVEIGDEFLKPYIAEAAARSADLFPVPKALFMALRNTPVSVSPGMWGECYEKYPLTVALEVTGYREVVFHECLHQFGLSEGYDQMTRHTDPECGNCWMQYDPAKGSGLCNRHLLELRTFVDGLEAE